MESPSPCQAWCCHGPFKLTTKMPNRPRDQTSPQPRPKHHTQPREDARALHASPELRITPSLDSSSSTPPLTPSHDHHRQPKSQPEVGGLHSVWRGGVSQPRAPGHCSRQSSPEEPRSAAKPCTQRPTQEQKIPPLQTPPQALLPSQDYEGSQTTSRAAPSLLPRLLPLLEQQTDCQAG